MPELNAAGLVFALAASALFGLQVMLNQRALQRVSASTGLIITLGVVVLCYLLIAPFTVSFAHLKSPGVWIFMANGLVHPLFSMFLSIIAAQRMGATVSATTSATSPLFATLGAVLFLDEHLTLLLLVGTSATVLGVVVLSWRGGGQTRWELSALVYPFGAALIRGMNHVVASFGLRMLPSPLLAALISFAMSFSIALGFYRISSGEWPTITRFGLIWFGGGGVCIAVAIWCMYSALSLGAVVWVSPIVATFPLFTLLFSLIFGEERFNVRILAGVLLVIGGVVWISTH